VNPRADSSLLAATWGRTQRLETVAIVGVVAAFGLTAGLVGLVIGLATAAVWYRVGTPYAIAVGHVLFVGLAPDAIGIVSVAIIEAALLGLLLAPAARSRTPVRVAVVTTLFWLTLAGLAWLALRSQPLWVAGAVSIGALALASYALYRYALVTFDLIDEPETTPTEHS